MRILFGKKEFNINYNMFMLEIKDKTIKELEQDLIYYTSSEHVLVHPSIVVTIFISIISFFVSIGIMTKWVIGIGVIMVLAIIFGIYNTQNENSNNKMKALIIQNRIKELQANQGQQVN